MPYEENHLQPEYDARQRADILQEIYDDLEKRYLDSKKRGDKELSLNYLERMPMLKKIIELYRILQC